MYYMVVAIRAAFLSVEFAWDISSEAQQIVSVLTLVLHGGVVLMLEFALNHQRRYRSYSILDKDKKVVNEAAPLLVKPLTVYDLVFSWETLFLFLFILYLGALVLHIFIPNKNLLETFWIVYLVVYFIQRIPIIVLVMIILLQKGGPIRTSKVFLAVGTVLYLCNDLPLKVWTHIFHVSTSSVVFSLVVNASVHNIFCVFV
jgi:hypothetical protein